jgi:hypothetical protein
MKSPHFDLRSNVRGGPAALYEETIAIRRGFSTQKPVYTFRQPAQLVFR